MLKMSFKTLQIYVSFGFAPSAEWYYPSDIIPFSLRSVYNPLSYGFSRFFDSAVGDCIWIFYFCVMQFDANRDVMHGMKCNKSVSISQNRIWYGNDWKSQIISHCQKFRLGSNLKPRSSCLLKVQIKFPKAVKISSYYLKMSIYALKNESKNEK